MKNKIPYYVQARDAGKLCAKKKKMYACCINSSGIMSSTGLILW